MAHFAELDSSNTVLRVLRVPDAQERRGEAFLRDDLGLGGTWMQTSYSASMRGRYAGIGMKYYAANDVFAPPQPYDSWTLDSTGTWNPPTPKPDDGGEYNWDEQSQSWIAA